MQPAGTDAFSHNVVCQKCPNICQTVTAVSCTSIASETWPLWIIPPAEGIWGFWVSHWQYPWRTDLVNRKNLLSGLRTIFMLISGCTSEFYKIFNTVGKMAAVFRHLNVPKVEGGQTRVRFFQMFYSSLCPWTVCKSNQDKLQQTSGKGHFVSCSKYECECVWESERGNIFVSDCINLDLWSSIKLDNEKCIEKSLNMIYLKNGLALILKVPKCQKLLSPSCFPMDVSS